MAIPENTQWEVRTTGHNDNGGGFCADYSGTDYSYQDDPQVVFDGSTITASTSGASDTITLTGYTVSNADKGNVLNITGGDNFTTGRYCIIAVNTGTNTWQLDRTCSTDAASGMTGRMGGAVAHPGVIMSSATDFNVVHIKSGTYYISTTTANVANGRIETTGAAQVIVGYESARWDFGTPPNFVISVNASAFRMGGSGGRSHFINLKVTATTSGTSLYGFDLGATTAGGVCVRCHAVNCYYGFTGYYHAYDCIAERTTTYSNSRGFSGGFGCYRCKAISASTYNMTIGFIVWYYPVVECYAYRCQYGFEGDGNTFVSRCVAESCQYGIKFAKAIKSIAYNCTYGFGDTIPGSGNWLPLTYDSVSHTCTYGVGYGRLLNHAFYKCTNNY